MLMISLYCCDNSDLPAAAYRQEAVGDETCRVVKAAVSVGKKKRSFILMVLGAGRKKSEVGRKEERGMDILGGVGIRLPFL